jgi:16S rRNA (cytosine967-C5)-methyltransferase
MMTGVSPARAHAFQILRTLESGRGRSDNLLRGRQVSALPPVDRNLTTALVLGVLRWQIDLDQRIRPLLKHPNAKLDTDVQIALRLGAFQLLHMNRIPARAAIDESVELTKQAGHRFASGMVNAVLRKLASAQTEPQTDPTQAYPRWIAERWTKSFGEMSTCTICRLGQEEPGTSVRLSTDGIEKELAAEGIELVPGELLTLARQVRSGDATKTAAFRDGRVRIQDEGSQLIAELVSHGREILDCCAAPGGKTLILAERNPEAQIVACDGSHQRLAELRKRLASLGERAYCRLVDVTHLEDREAFDVVLADVPCSGTGTLGRNPEIRHRLRPEDLPRQAERQRAILQSALRAVRPGGYVLYSTCSLEAEENENVIESVLSEAAGARLLSLRARIEELGSGGILSEPGIERLLQCITTEGILRLLPGVFHTDGFFAALIAKER